MGDYRMNVSISITGPDSRTAKIEWWVNWWPDKPELLYRELVKGAKQLGLEVEDKTYLFDSES
jgi:hypothetical protein